MGLLNILGWNNVPKANTWPMLEYPEIPEASPVQLQAEAIGGKINALALQQDVYNHENTSYDIAAVEEQKRTLYDQLKPLLLQLEVDNAHYLHLAQKLDDVEDINSKILRRNERMRKEERNTLSRSSRRLHLGAAGFILTALLGGKALDAPASVYIAGGVAAVGYSAAARKRTNANTDRIVESYHQDELDQNQY